MTVKRDDASKCAMPGCENPRDPRWYDSRGHPVCDGHFDPNTGAPPECECEATESADGAPAPQEESSDRTGGIRAGGTDAAPASPAPRPPSCPTCNELVKEVERLRIEVASLRTNLDIAKKWLGTPPGGEADGEADVEPLHQTQQASRGEIEAKDECPSGKHIPSSECPTWKACLQSGRWDREIGVFLVWAMDARGFRTLCAVTLTQGQARRQKKALESEDRWISVRIESTDANHLFYSTVRS